MSNVNRALVEDEFDTMVEVLSDRHFGKPYLIETKENDLSPLTGRVEAVLDKQFANGSMPA
jgi:hypothetical protein